jgi:antitoxin HigA-1
MAMNSPAHPGELIRSELTFLGYSTAEAASAIGVTRQQLHKVISGRGSVTPDMAMRLEKGIGGAAETWLQMQMNYDLAKVRKRESDFHVRRLVSRAA